MLPFEIIVIGTPLSHQTRNRSRLRAGVLKVREEAIRTWPPGSAIETGDVRISVTYFHERPSVRIDGDNMLKPIQDALIGVVYADDRQIIDADVQKRNIDGAFRVRRMSPVLAQGFVVGEEFVYVRVEHVQDRTVIV